MTTRLLTPVSPRQTQELRNGDRMAREEFHRLYEQMPENFRAELVGGIVYVASPLSLPHSDAHLLVGALFTLYQGQTPGTQAGNNATVLLGDEGEPQPDLFLRVRPEYGGQSATSTKLYVQGAPELVTEIAYTSRALDLHAKREDYQRYGVLEYVVFSLLDRRVHWFDLRNRKELPVPPDGILKAATFPGLWLHADPIFANDTTRAISALQQGLASPEHAGFVQRLAAARSDQVPPQ
jgi:hypothetical protein